MHVVQKLFVVDIHVLYYSVEKITLSQSAFNEVIQLTNNRFAVRTENIQSVQYTLSLHDFTYFHYTNLNIGN